MRFSPFYWPQFRLKPDGEDCMILPSLVLSQYQRVIDRQTDGRTRRLAWRDENSIVTERLHIITMCSNIQLGLLLWWSASQIWRNGAALCHWRHEISQKSQKFLYKYIINSKTELTMKIAKVVYTRMLQGAHTCPMPHSWRCQCVLWHLHFDSAHCFRDIYCNSAALRKFHRLRRWRQKKTYQRSSCTKCVKILRKVCPVASSTAAYKQPGLVAITSIFACNSGFLSARWTRCLYTSRSRRVSETDLRRRWLM